MTGCCLHRGTLQWREFFWPAVVARGVEAEVDDRGAVSGGGRERGVGEIAVDGPCTGRDASPAAADDDDIVARLEQLAGDVGADLAGSEDDVVAHCDSRCCLRASSMGRIDVAAVTTSAPLEPKTVYWASTSMPADAVIVQPSAHRPASSAGHTSTIRPSRRYRTAAWATPMTAPQIAP